MAEQINDGLHQYFVNVRAQADQGRESLDDWNHPSDDFRAGQKRYRVYRETTTLLDKIAAAAALMAEVEMGLTLPNGQEFRVPGPLVVNRNERGLVKPRIEDSLQAYMWMEWHEPQAGFANLGSLERRPRLSDCQ